MTRLILILGITLVSPTIADEVARPVAVEPIESLRIAANLVSDHARTKLRVGEKVSESESGPVLFVGNLVTLSEAMDDVALAPSAPAYTPDDLGLGIARRSRSAVRSPASTKSNLGDVLALDDYFVFRDYVIANKDEWEELRANKYFYQSARRQFDIEASLDTNHRSREVFARFLSGLDPGTPTSASATPEKDSAEKTH